MAGLNRKGGGGGSGGRRQRPQIKEEFQVPKLLYVMVFLTVAVGVGYMYINQVPEHPHVDLERWWGPGPPTNITDTRVKEFRVQFNDEMIKDLKSRLRNRPTLTRPLEGVMSEYGINTNYLSEVLDYWQQKYNFKERERLLNDVPHFKTNIQGLDIHFIHVKPEIPADRQVEVVPLMLLHGWPSSSKEFMKVIPHLVTPRPGYDFVFEVILPDLPGFGFSQGTTKTGLNAMQISIIMRNLMHRLGFKKFYVQGGDWGSHCASSMATLFPDEILGLHLNLAHSDMTVSYIKLLMGTLFPTLVAGSYADRIYPLSNLFAHIIRETGYFHIQATKPDTVGVALSDSPAGLAGYILEKVGAVTSRGQLDRYHGGIGDSYEVDDLLDMLTIVWANRCITTSMRIYAESTGPMKEADSRSTGKITTVVPTAVINFKNEILYQPDWVLRDKYPNLVHTTTLDYGGHFPGMEHPDVLALDIWEATEMFIKFNAQQILKNET